MGVKKEKSEKRKEKSYGLEAGVLILIVAWLLLAAVPGPEDKVVFLDVGQGDSILLQNGTRQVLIDGGPGMTVLTRLGEEMPWFDRSIEVVVLTHPQQDHMEGLLHVLDRYEVGMVLLPKIAHTSQMQEEWLERIVEKDIDYRFAWAGQRLEVGEIAMRILGPIDSEEAKAAIKANLNNASMVARVDYCSDETPPSLPLSPLRQGFEGQAGEAQGSAGINAPLDKGGIGGISEPVVGCLSFLLTGDIEKRVENILVQNTREDLLDVDVLKAGHHGSKTSTNEILIDKATPAAAVISVGSDNKFGHPHGEVLERLKGMPIWRTDEVGSVRFRHLPDGQWIIR